MIWEGTQAKVGRQEVNHLVRARVLDVVRPIGPANGLALFQRLPVGGSFSLAWVELQELVRIALPIDECPRPLANNILGRELGAP